MTKRANCVFCSIPAERIVYASEHAIAVPDGFPVAKGHSLVIPLRHVQSIYELSETEQTGLWQLVSRVREKLQVEFHPDGFNIGLNDGAAAGQTVPHAHVHVIPRYAGDVPDPRGGIRWIIPDKAKYWTE